MSLIAVTTSQGLSVISSAALHPSHPNPAPTFTTTLTPPSRIPSACISWSQDASTVFVASGGSVSAYDPTSGAWLRDVVREGEGGIGGAKLASMAVLDSQDGSSPTLALARGSRAVVFNSETRRPVLTIEGHKSSIFAMSLACDQSLLATCSAETTMITNLAQQSNIVLRGAPAGATAAAFHPSRRTTLLILSPKGLHVFDTTKGGAPIRTIPISKAEGSGGSIAFSPCTPALVAVAVPGGGGRIVLLDIDKDSSLLKKYAIDENITSLSFSHDGAAIIVGTEAGRVIQLSLRSTDQPAPVITVDPSGGKIGGLALIAESPEVLTAIPNSVLNSAATLGTKSTIRATRTESVTSASTGGSVRVKASATDLRGTLRTRPSLLDIGATSPQSPRVTSPETLRNKSPQILRARSSTIDLAKKPSMTELRAKPSMSELRERPSTADLRSKTSPGGLRVKAGVENKVRPTSMISAGAGKERVRVRPVSLVEEKDEVEGEAKAAIKTRDTLSRGNRPSVIDLKALAGAPSPGSKTSASPSGGSPVRTTISPPLRRQTQTMTMPRRLTSESSRPSLTQIFAQDDVGTTRSRSSSHSTGPPPLSAPHSQTSLSDTGRGSSTPLVPRSSLVSTTPNYTPGQIASGSTSPDYEAEDKVLVPRTAERERPYSRLGEERARSRLGSETPRLPSLPTIEDRPRSRVGEDRPRSRAFVDGSESERERPASRMFKDDIIDRPSSRVGSGTLGLGRPTGLARRFSSDLKVTPDTMRVISESGIARGRVEEEEDEVVKERPASAMRERPEPKLRERPSSVFRERPESVFRERLDSITRERSESGLRSATPMSASSVRGKRVGWVDKESPVSVPLDTVFTPSARPKSGLASGSVSGSISSDESDCAHRGGNALLVTPRRGLAAALGAEVYAGDAPPTKNGNGSITRTQAQDMLRNIVSDVMFEFRQEAKEDVRGLHLDLLRASRGWKTDLKEYLGDTLEELRLVKEENARLRAEIARLRRGY